jgi:hypothetical protein
VKLTNLAPFEMTCKVPEVIEDRNDLAVRKLQVDDLVSDVFGQLFL